MKLLIINGPNINFLGIREPAIYGSTTYKDLCGILETWCADAGASCELFQPKSREIHTNSFPCL